MNLSKLGLVICIVALLLIGAGFKESAMGSSDLIRINIEEEELVISKDFGVPFIDNNSRAMIPLRAVSEGLGHDVGWKASHMTAIIDERIFVQIDNPFIMIKGEDYIRMDTSAVLIDTRTFVPLRFVVEALGYEVEYEEPRSSNNYHHTININGDI